MSQIGGLIFQKTYQGFKTLQYARSKVDYVIGESIYMLLIDMNLQIGKIKSHSNQILISSSGFNIGTNLKINLDDDKHIEKDKPDIKSKNEDKRDTEMMKTEPDMNEMTYKDLEKAALILGISYLYSMVDIQMIYFLLVFVKICVHQNSNTCYKCSQSLR